MATHSSILARIIPWAEEPGGVTWGHKELDTTELLLISYLKVAKGVDLQSFHPWLPSG